MEQGGHISVTMCDIEGRGEKCDVTLVIEHSFPIGQKGCDSKILLLFCQLMNID